MTDARAEGSALDASLNTMFDARRFVATYGTALAVAIVFCAFAVFAPNFLNPTNLLQTASKIGVTTLGWIWKEDKNDNNALLGPGGAPFDGGQYQWGKIFYDFCRAERK